MSLSLCLSYRWVLQTPWFSLIVRMGLANPMVLIDSKNIFELPVDLANPMVLINSKSIFELSVGLANPKFLIDNMSMFELLVGLANPKVLIGSKIYLSYLWVF